MKASSVTKARPGGLGIAQLHSRISEKHRVGRAEQSELPPAPPLYALPSHEHCLRKVDHDDNEHAALNAFNELWRTKFAHDSLLVFSTGRSHHLYEELRVRTLPVYAPLDQQRQSSRLGYLCSLFDPR